VQDEHRSFQLNFEAANGVNIDAALNLGIEYAYGRGTDKNFEQAFHWYSIAAKAGNVIAQHNLGAAYAKGEGTPIDYIDAQYWYLTAAKKGSYLSQLCLGQMYEEGQGVEIDLIKALSWYFLSRNTSDNPELISLIQNLEKKLDQTEVAEAKKLASKILETTQTSDLFDKYKQSEVIASGIEAYEDGKFEEALEALKMPALQGNMLACRYTGLMLRFGLGQEPDYAEAIKYFD